MILVGLFVFGAGFTGGYLAALLREKPRAPRGGMIDLVGYRLER